MEKLNVCLINDSFPPAIDGVANAVTNYARIIKRDYGNPTVVTPYYPDADDAVFDFPVIRYPSVDMTKLVGYRAGIPFSPEISAKMETSNFDIIHSHCPITSTLLARSVRWQLKVPLVFTYHTKFDIDIANAIHSQILREEAARLLVENIASCDEVWTVSHGAGENLRQLGYEGDWIVMPNGVDFPKGRVDDRLIDEVTSEFPLPADVPLFLFVGRMMWYKGIRISLDALKTLQEDGYDFRMVFVGGGTDKEEIMQYSSEAGLDGRVFFADPIHDRDRIRAWYCRADLFLFPSTFDTNGLVVREAAACGLASVLVEGSCAAEDVEDDVSGFFIEENAVSMAEKLRKLLDHPEAMKTVGQGAQENIYISWDTAVKGAYERYGVVIENYRAGKYPVPGKLSDERLKRIGDFLNLVGQRELAAQELRERMVEELQQRKIVRFDAAVTDRFFQRAKGNLTGIKDHLDARQSKFEEDLKEFYDIFL